jgi:hypothetical protein
MHIYTNIVILKSPLKEGLRLRDHHDKEAKSVSYFMYITVCDT